MLAIIHAKWWLVSIASVRRAQSSASRLLRNVVAVVGQPFLRMTAFYVPEGVLTMVAMYLF